MNSTGRRTARSQRVAGLDPVPKFSTQLWQTITRSDVLIRVAICALAMVVMIIATRAWAPPFAYREGYTPSRDIVARVDFKMPNPNQVERERENARRQARQVYINNPQPLRDLRAALLTEIAKITEAKEGDAEVEKVWAEFAPRPVTGESASDEEKQILQQQWRRDLAAFRMALEGQRRLRFDAAVEKGLADIQKRGLFEKLEKEQGNQTEILVYPENEWEARERVEVKDIQIANAKFELAESLQRELLELETEAKDAARSETKQIYVHDAAPLVKLRGTLIEKIKVLREATELDEATAATWKEFLPAAGEASPAVDATERQKQFDQFRQLLTDDATIDLETGLAAALGEFERRGILLEMKSPDEVPEGNLQEIVVVDFEPSSTPTVVAVSEVRLADIKPVIRENLEKQLKSLEIAGRIFTWLERQLPDAATLQYRPAAEGESPAVAQPALAERTYRWLENRLPTTLTYDDIRGKEVRDDAADAVLDEQFATPYHAGDDAMAKAGQPLDAKTLERLRAEHAEILKGLTAAQMFNRLLAIIGMYLAVYSLCGLFIYFRYPTILNDLRRFCGLLALAVFSVVVCYLSDNWKAEMIPMLLFCMTVAIAYNQELALLTAAVVGLIIVLSLGHGLAAFVILMAASATAVLMLRRVRSRVKLVYVGICSGTVAMLTSIGVSVLDNQPLGQALFTDSGLFFLCGVAAGFAMTGLLPFIESLFGVLTEISLLELGDVAHPLLQELVRRAPGTYNHSINVASMAESAAESIGAQGLLLRVGAYFHDIGKMLKPQYFIENQSDGANRHESLVPAMSTLIIIAHVKDGADLARQHHLPRPVIDFVQQHHGTTLVEYFYRRASENSQADPDASEVDEHTFRYPGPKPQTKEAGILMLADAVESASRVLVEPTPSRIESLVEEIAMKRLLDGQLDECGLSLQEVRTVQDSLVKSLTAVYHGRVKYPDQRTA